MADPYARPRDGFTAKEFVRNLKAFEDAGRLLDNPHRIDIRKPTQITMIEYNRKSGGEVWGDDEGRIYKEVRLTRGFHRRFESFLGAFFWWDLPLGSDNIPWIGIGETPIKPRTVDTRLLLIFCGMHRGEEGKKVARVKGICTPEQGDDLIRMGVFKDRKEIEAYMTILGILEPSLGQGDVSSGMVY